MLILVHVAGEAANAEFPMDAGPTSTAKESMTTIVKGYLAKFGSPTKILTSPYHIALQTYGLVKPVLDAHGIKTIMREPRLSKFISNKIPTPHLRTKTVVEGQAGKYVGETEENFKKRVRECYNHYFNESTKPGANIWLITHSDVMEYMASLVNYKFPRPTDYHSFLAIPPKGDILSYQMLTRAPTTPNMFDSDPIVPVVENVPSSSTRVEDSRLPDVAKVALPSRMASRTVEQMKLRQKKEEKRMKDAIVGYPKKGGFRPYESSSSSSSDSSSDSDNSSDDGGFISQRASDLLAMTAGGIYRPPPPQHFQSRSQARHTKSPYDPSDTEAISIIERMAVPDRRRGGKRALQPKKPAIDLSRFGEEFEDEFLNDDDLESIA